MEREVAVQSEPFEFEVEFPKDDREKGKIILRGDLENTEEARKKLSRLGNLPSKMRFAAFSVEASGARIGLGGEEAWIYAVHDFLAGCGLVYASSQLAEILKYDGGKRYLHHFSDFQEQGVATAVS